MNLFEKIIAREIAADIVYEDEYSLAFRDINPAAPVHCLVIPKRCIERIAHARDDDRDLLGHLMMVAARVAKQEGLEAGGYRLVVNNGEDAGQSVFHLHIHVLGGRKLGWPPG